MTYVINGTLIGALYATFAVGLVLVFGAMRTVNFAYGAVIVGGGYVTAALAPRLGLDPLVALVVVIPPIAAVAYLLQRGVLGRLQGQNNQMVATFGLAIVLETVLLMVFGGDPKTIRASYTLTGVDILGTTVRTILVIALGFGIALLAITHLGLTRTRFGKPVRAAAENPEAAASVGINVPHVHAVTFAVASALAGVSGTMIALAFSLTPTADVSWLLRGFVVVVLGGMGSLWGVLLGGVVVGLAEQLGAATVGPSYRDLVVFSLLVLVLVIRPQGLFAGRLA